MTQEKPQGGSERPENGPVDHFQRRTGRQALERLGWGEARPENDPVGEEGPKNRPVACFYRRTGRQALGSFQCRTGPQALVVDRQNQ